MTQAEIETVLEAARVIASEAITTAVREALRAHREDLNRELIRMDERVPSVLRGWNFEGGCRHMLERIIEGLDRKIEGMDRKIEGIEIRELNLDLDSQVEVS